MDSLLKRSFLRFGSPVGSPLQVCRFSRRLVIGALLCAALSSPVWSQGTLPEFFGVYAVVDGKLAPLVGGRGTFTPDRHSLQVYNFQTMFQEKEDAFVFEGKRLHFLVFDAAVADTSANLELYRLPFARNVIPRPDALAQVGGLLDQVSGRAPGGQPPTTPLQRFVVAKTDALKVELLQKPVAGQSQMVQLVPATMLEPGMYALFTVRMQGGQQFIVDQIFELKGSPETPYCIDLAMTGGMGGAMAASDARLARPYYLSKDDYIICSAANASDTRGANPPLGNVNSGNTANGSAACGDYNACLQVAKNAYGARDWPKATVAFRAAANQSPQSGEPWIWLGRILLQDGQPHSSQDLSQIWDKALSLGGEILIGACHEQAFRPCERGDLTLSNKAIQFLASGSRTVFAVSPAEIDPGRILNNSAAGHIAYSLKISGKNYRIDFIPLGVACTFNLMVQCPQEGIREQLIEAEYVSQAIPKLAHGMEGR